MSNKKRKSVKISIFYFPDHQLKKKKKNHILEKQESLSNKQLIIMMTIKGEGEPSS